VDIGQNFIKIGPEMRILERFFEIGAKHLDFDGIAISVCTENSSFDHLQKSAMRGT